MKSPEPRYGPHKVEIWIMKAAKQYRRSVTRYGVGAPSKAGGCDGLVVSPDAAARLLGVSRGAQKYRQGSKG